MVCETKYYETEKMFHVYVPQIMGTRFDMLVIDVSREKSDRIWSGIACQIELYDKLLNRFDASSEVSAVNAAISAGRHIIVCEEFAEVLRNVAEYHEATGELFDITRRDFSALHLEGEELWCDNDGLDLDFGGYGKGAVLRQIKSILDENAVATAFVNFGNSSIFAKGRHPVGDCWKVDLPSPYDGHLVSTFSLTDMSLSTSGNTPNYSSHICNPRTGEYVSGRLMTTVVCPDPLDAEVLSTAMMLADDVTADVLRGNFPDAVMHRYVL